MVKVLLVAHWDWVLYNFRLPLAKALREHGYDVVFVCPFGEYVNKLMEAGFRCIHWSIIRRSVNPLEEIKALFHLAYIYRQERPNLVHHFTVKPNLLGSLAARLVTGLKGKNQLRVINTFTGLGFLFSDHLMARLLRVTTLPLFRFGQNGHKVWIVCQNFEDREKLIQLGLATPSRTFVIVSSGVETRRFSPNSPNASHSSRTPIVLMAARLLWDKGVKEFVEAAQLLKERGVKAEFWLAGKPDDGNPMAVPEEFLQRWSEQGIIRWLGHCDNMPELLRQVDVAVLPTSYHEGVPRFLLEAAATGLPLVATDIEGCRMVVRNGVNGYLVPIRNAHALADAIERLVRNPQLRLQMGKASREIIVKEFDERKILNQWLRLYERVLTS